MSLYNVHGTIGKQKGKFIKKKIKAKIEKLLETVKKRNSSKSEVTKKFPGCRIVELDKLAEELWCEPCDSSLSLRHAIKEKKEGLASNLRVRCKYCSNVKRVTTSSKTSKKPYFDINLKLAVVMYDSGMGERSINTLLSALNVPTVGSTSLKRYEGQVGPAILNLADQSCRDNIDLEKRLTQKKFDAPRIIKLAESLGLLKELNTFIKGFGDTMCMFKEILTDRKKEKKSFAQPMLVDDYLPKTDILVAHNAINDVIMLGKLLVAVNVEKSVIFNSTQTISYMINSKEILKKRKAMKDSLLSINVSKNIKSKMVQTGIDLNSLKEAYRTGNYDGLQFLLAEAVNNKPRVTSNKKIIKNIFEQLESKKDEI